MLPPDNPTASLAAFTVPGMARGVWSMIEADLRTPGVTDMTAEYGPRLVEQERCAYLRPTILHAESPDSEAAKREYMFPFATVVQCPQEQMLAKIGPTLVCTAFTRNPALIRQLTDAMHIDRLNVGPIPTTRLNWLQPHEGNLIDFLFRSRAYQVADDFVGNALMSTAPFDFRLPTRIVFGVDAVEQLGDLARELPAQRVLLVSDPGVAAAGHTRRAIESLEHAGLTRAAV